MRISFDDTTDAFAAAIDLEPENAYADLERMLEDAIPEVVSICTPPAPPLGFGGRLHPDCVRAIHCEKPMAVTYGESRSLFEVCAENDVQLTVNLQNRCSSGARDVKRLIDDDAIGDLEQIQVDRHDLLQTGIHHIDLANFVMDDELVEWVLGQIDYPEGKR